jgi:hypothetical protein
MILEILIKPKNLKNIKNNLNHLVSCLNTKYKILFKSLNHKKNKDYQHTHALYVQIIITVIYWNKLRNISLWLMW